MRPLKIVLLSATLALSLPGCGSSGSGSSSSSSSTSATSTPRSLKVITTPKFAPPGNGPVQSGVVQVSYRNITIRPGTLRVRLGTTVRWSNFDNAQHNVTSISGAQHFASPNFGEGQGYAVKLTRPGIIHYECTIHPVTMNATIQVLR